MTTVAFDGESIAYDSKMSYHAGNVQKVFTLPDGSVVGGAGDYSKILQSVAFLAGEGPKPEVEKDNYPELMLIRNKRVYMSLDCGYTWMAIQDKKFAIGSGSGYAMGAMHAGKSALDAVKIAAKLDSGTGGKIVSVRCDA